MSQYQTFSIPYDGEEYSITLKAEAAENIADNGGTRAMYQAYERLPEARKECVPGFNFTSDQLFWVVFNYPQNCWIPICFTTLFRLETRSFPAQKWASMSISKTIETFSPIIQ